jgi:hypothetical protein
MPLIVMVGTPDEWPLQRLASNAFYLAGEVARQHLPNAGCVSVSSRYGGGEPHTGPAMPADQT